MEYIKQEDGTFKSVDTVEVVLTKEQLEAEVLSLGEAIDSLMSEVKRLTEKKEKIDALLK